MNGTVSILIAAYKAGPFLSKALDGISAQLHTDWELIVVEDGSHDETESLVQTFAASHAPRRVVYDNLGSNRGVSAARNRLLELAKGDVFAFLDADDWWAPEHLQSLLTCLEDGHSLVFSGIELWDGERNQSQETYCPDAEWVKEPRRWLLERSFIYTSSCVAFPHKTAERVGRFDEKLRIGEDRDFWLRAVEGGTLGCTRLNTCCYRKHAASSMSKTMLVASDTVQFYRKHLNASGVPAGMVRRKLAEAEFSLGRLVRSSDPKQARGLFFSVWKVAPWRPKPLVLLLLACMKR